MPLRLISLVLLLTFVPSMAMGLPAGGRVAGGAANVNPPKGQTLNINQLTDKAIINWKGFNIDVNELVRFIQPSSKSIVLNRVTGVDPSSLLGRLIANGRVFIINPNGILFGPNSVVDVAGLLATTLNIRDADFMAGKFTFAQDPSKNPAFVVNQGQIKVSDNGFVFLVAPGVSNQGLIIANLGKVVMGSGERLTVDFMGDGLITFAIEGKVLNTVMGPDGVPLNSAVANTGTIKADGGQVILTAKASSEIFSSVVNNSGVIEAKSLVNRGGVISLQGSDPVSNTAEIGWQANLGKVQNSDGRVLNTGALDVSAREAGAAAGEVTLSGQIVGSSGSILARGADGAQGGRVLVTSSEKTILTQDSVIDTSGVGNSSAGNTVVWSDKGTVFRGTIIAKGGETGGNGGQIEVSGHENLGFTGQVNALAPKGSIGSVLLDPRNITVANGGVASLPQVDQFSDTPGADQTIAPATINAAAANVVLQANNDITVTNAIAMTNSGVGITMQAGRDVNVNASVSTNNGNISLTANDSAATAANRSAGTGDITFGAAGNLSSGTGNISLNVGSSPAAPFSPGSINTVRNLTTTGGNISINSPNNVSLSGAVNAGSGTVAINANTDGAGAQGFTMNAGSSITTTGGVNINVNAAGVGTGAASLRNISTGGTLTVQTNTGGNTTGGAIGQSAGTTINVGTANLSTGNGAITLNNATNNFGTVAVSRATNVTLQDVNALNLGASTVSGTLNVTAAGAITDSGNLNVTGTTTLAAGVGNDITLDSAGNNFSTVAITSGRNVTLVDSNALNLGASTVSGNLNVTTAGAITDSGNLTVTGSTTLAAGASNDITLNNANNFSTVSITSGRNVTLNDTNALSLGTSTVSGTLGVTTNGAITQSGAINVTGTTSLGAGAASDITLNNPSNNFSTVGISSGRNVTLVDSNALDLGSSTIAGALNVTAGGTLTDSGNLAVTGTTTLAAGAGNDITLDNGNNFSTVAITSGRNVTLNDTNALILGASTVSGTLNVTSNGTITDSGNVVATGMTTLAAGAGNDITLNNANNFSTVSITSGRNVTLNDTNALDLGASTVSGTLNLTTAGAITDSGNVNVAGTTTLAAGAGNDIALDSAGNNLSTVAITSGRNVTLVDSNALNLGASTISGTLNMTTAGAITDSGNVVVIGTTTLAAGAGNNITLDSAGNNFGTVAITSGNNVTLRDANALNLGASTTSGNLSVTTAGAITDSGDLNVTGTTTLAAGAGNDITLDSAGNNFSTVAITSGRNITLVDSNALNLGTSTVSGTLNVTTAGAITDGGNVVVTGTTTLAAGAGNDITLDNANNFSTVSITSGRHVALNDTNALFLGTSTVSGTLGVTTAGALNQSGALNVTGTTTLAAGSGNDITLNNASNNFTTVGITSGRNVTLVDSNALDLGTSTIAGTLNVTAAGALTDSGNLNVTGTTTLAAGAGNDITLDSAGNNFSTAAITSGRNVTLVDSNALNLGTSTVSGTLNVTTAGAITDSGNVNVTGTTTLAAGGENDITLNSAGNNFSTLGIASGRNVTLVDSNSLDLGTSSVSGSLGLTTGGAVTQSGALSVAGTTSFTASAANTDILLNTQANDFGGIVSFAGTQSNFRDIALRNTNAGATVPTLSGLTSLRNLTLEYDNAGVNLPALTANGTLSVIAGGTITQSGNLNVAGTTTLAAGTHDVNLNNAGNNFSSVSITSANNVTLRDANALDLGASIVSGTLDITSNETMTQSGPVAAAGATTLAAGAGDITLDNAANDFSTVRITSANNVTLQDSNSVSLGTSTVTGNFSVAAGGAILDGDGSAINIAAATANLISASNIGTAADPVETNVGTLNATTTGGGIFINEANAVTLGNISSGGGNDIVISNAIGNMTVNSVTTAGGAVTLASPGGAIQDGNGAANNVTAGSLMVSAANGIDLDTTMTALSSASVTGTGSIDISNAGALAVNNATTTDGNIALNATGGNLVINMVTAGGIGTVALATTTSGDVMLGTVATPNNVTITSAGNITDANGAAYNINANTATLTASVNIGTSGDPIETSVGTLNGTATAGGIYINETDAVTLNNIVAGGGNVAISNTRGDMIINSITATTGGIDLTASAGSILDGNGSANNLTAVADSNLRAWGGVIGLSTDPIEVNINPGMLGVAATGQAGGVSVDINGTVLPANALTLLNSPPGEVIFNSRVLNPSPVNLPNLTGIASELNMQRVNEEDYFTELLIGVLGDDFFKAQPNHCELDDSLREKLDSDLC